MKVRTKIALLVLIVVGTFVAGLITIKTWDYRKFRQVSAEYDRERQKSFDAFIERWTRSLDVMANDLSCWDDMVAAVTKGDRGWAETNLGDGALTTSRANAIW